MAQLSCLFYVIDGTGLCTIKFTVICQFVRWILMLLLVWGWFWCVRDIGFDERFDLSLFHCFFFFFKQCLVSEKNNGIESVDNTKVCFRSAPPPPCVLHYDG